MHFQAEAIALSQLVRDQACRQLPNGWIAKPKFRQRNGSWLLARMCRLLPFDLDELRELSPQVLQLPDNKDAIQVKKRGADYGN